jgi:hypothetical protein
MRTRSLWRKHYVLPAEHGAWIWWIGPLFIGAVAGGRPDTSMIILTLAALAAFLLRQPATLAVKSLAGRRSAEELRPALFWSMLYALLAVAGAAWLVGIGERQVLALALPGMLIFAWHLWLVSRRQERQRPGVEIFAAGALALTAPAAYWVSGGDSDQTAWLLWGVLWLQSAASIVHVYLRLAQRRLDPAEAIRARWRMGRRSLIYHTFNLLSSLALVAAGWMPPLIPAAFGLVFLDSLDGTARPAVGARPTQIGVRQLLISSAFALLMMLAFLLA